MSDILKKLRRPKHGVRVSKASSLKKKLQAHSKQLRSFVQSQQKETRAESDKRVSNFRRWCKKVGLELHPNVCLGLSCIFINYVMNRYHYETNKYLEKIYIGEHGSCHKIGVVATEFIGKGECLAVIPRQAILSCSNSSVADAVQSYVASKQVTSSWVPLLITLAAECSLKSKSQWNAYLNLVPNNGECGPPMLWSEAEHARLLEGTGVGQLVEDDLKRIEDDFTDIVLPFMKNHPQLFRSEVQDYAEYKKLVSFVMSYSFTDAEDSEVTSSTMMVPFVDLLNHSSQHHAELTFTDKALRLMVVRDIDKGEEVMNTYGELSNTSLLHTYGFCEPNNPHDIVLLPVHCVQQIYTASDDQDSVANLEKQWQQIESDDLLEDNYSIDKDGDPDLDLLLLIKLLYADKKEYKSLVKKHARDDLDDLTVKGLSQEQSTLLFRLVKYRLSLYPESCDSLQPLLSEDVIVEMTEKEKYGLYLTLGQQQCLRTLLNQMQEQ